MQDLEKATLSLKNICDNPVTFPHNVQVSSDCKNLITSVLFMNLYIYIYKIKNKFKLLKKKPIERLGSKGEAEEIKKHPWFKSINFNDLMEKKLVAPFIP